MERLTQEYMYLEKLNMQYFVDQIQVMINYHLENNSDPEYVTEKLNYLLKQVAALRDVYFLFSIDNIERLMQPVRDAIQKINECNKE
jgi:hypothetical protein